MEKATYAGESKLQGYKVGIIETKEGVKGKSKLSKLLVNIDDDSTFDCHNPRLPPRLGRCIRPRLVTNTSSGCLPRKLVQCNLVVVKWSSHATTYWSSGDGSESADCSAPDTVPFFTSASCFEKELISPRLNRAATYSCLITESP